MRLIDADELPIKYDGHTVSVWKCDIDNAPTVEAIPIKWLKTKTIEELCKLLEEWEKENETV